MSRKIEIRQLMAEAQRQFSALSAEVKEIEAQEKADQNLEKFKEYKFKIGTFGYELQEEDKIKDLTDDDRRNGHVGASGLAYTGFHAQSEHFDYVMLRAKEDYARTQTILTKMHAAQQVADPKVKEKEKYIKILLGEV